ncbi:MAG: hypothetical protein KKD98_03205, partial [Candidatus Thermoplasmatota archaeon]|nr:hypothetical protein [Candidatus Thermoplasmatota archaeon]
KCAGCGVEFTEKMDEKVQEDDFAELEVEKVQPQPTPVTPTVEPPGAQEPPKSDTPQPPASGAEEPRKPVKKKVALKF